VPSQTAGGGEIFRPPAEVTAPQSNLAGQEMAGENGPSNWKGGFLSEAMDVKTFARAVRHWPTAQLAELIAELIEILRAKPKPPQ